MSVQFLWTNTDSQIPQQGAAAPPSEDSWNVAKPLPIAPVQAMVWLYEQGEMPLLQAIDDGGWTAYFTVGTSVLSRPDVAAANDELPTPLSVTPNEDWDVVRILGLPVPVPPPRMLPAYPLWHQDTRVAQPSAASPETDGSPMLFLRTQPKQAHRYEWAFDQESTLPHTGGGGHVVQITAIALSNP